MAEERGPCRGRPGLLDAIPDQLRYRVYYISFSTITSSSSSSRSAFTNRGNINRHLNDVNGEPPDSNDTVFPQKYYVFYGVQYGPTWLGYWCTHGGL